jgi:hypothetical protein
MNQRGGITATVALLVATLLGMSYLPRKSAEPAKAEAARKLAAKSGLAAVARVQGSSAEKLIGSCEQIRRRLDRFYPDGVPVPPKGDCYANAAQGPALKAPDKAPVHFVVAIVPNPVQTHLPLMFDRQIDAIQQAVQDTGFSYDGSWFPWNQTDRSYESLSDEQQSALLAAELQEQPGIMVFRRGSNPIGDKEPYGDGLAVFVVAEQPTGGLSDVQFTHALNWIVALQAEPGELRIIGPTFSGSLASLARELEATDAFSKYPDGIQIYSGATNADENVNSFKDFLSRQAAPQSPNGKAKEPNRFRTFFESDSLMTDRFLCYMQHEGYDLDHFAILSEDETAFGKAGGKDAVEKPRCQDHVHQKDGKTVFDYEGTPVYLYYPRDIATLRSAYEQQSIFSAGKQPTGAPSTSLKEDLSEPASSEHDTVRTYAGQLTPQSQEAALFGISNVLDQKNIEFVIVRSTNTLDQLFLSEFLRRSYPTGRVVIDGADLMFRRGMQGASLRGVMLLSPYPLLSWTHDAVAPIEGGRNYSYRVFPQDSSEGTYIAARELLKGLRGDAPVIPISDYAAPGSASDNPPSGEAKQRPPTWVTVVGHRQFWPVAVLNEKTDLDSDGATHYGPFRTSLLEAEPAFRNTRPGRTGLPGEMWGLLLFCLVLGGWHYYVCSSGSIYRPPRLRADFAPVPWVQHTVLIFLGSLLLAFLAATMWFVVVFGVKALTLKTALGSMAILLAMVVLAFMACVRNYRLKVITGVLSSERSDTLKRIELWRRRLRLFWFPAFAIFVVGRYFFLAYHLSLANRFPAYWRSVFLRSGVSPLMPQVLLILGLYAWYYMTLHGLALFGDDRPSLPNVDDLPQLESAASKQEEAHGAHTRLIKVFRVLSQEGAGNNIEGDARPLGGRYVRSLAYLWPISFLVFWIALGEPSLRTLGDIRFGRAIFLGVSVCIGLILADTLQLMNTWSQLRQLLIYLDRLRLRRTLATLRGLYGGSVWRLSGNVLEERYRLISRQFESMRNLHNTLTAWKTNGMEEEQRKQTVLNELEQCEIYGRAFTIWYADLLDDEIKDHRKEYDITPMREFQRMLAATAGCVMKLVILPEWQMDPNTMIRVASSKDLETDFDQQVASLPAHVSAAEEFFLLPYMGFIQNILGRVRTIAFSIVTLFVAVTVAVSCYPFDPLPVIGAVFLILFALVGTGMIFAYAEMCRDATLSRIANTTPGELGLGFWMKLAAFGFGPLLGLLTTLFPSMADFIVSFLQPGAQAFK